MELAQFEHGVCISMCSYSCQAFPKGEIYGEDAHTRYKTRPGDLSPTTSIPGVYGQTGVPTGNHMVSDEASHRKKSASE